MLSAVLFDLDGVITDTAHLHYKAWKSIADQEGIYFDLAINERLKGISRMDSLLVMMEKRTREYTQQELEALTELKNTRYVAMLDSLTPSDVLPGILPLLDSLHEAGIKTAVVSVSKNTHTILNKLNIRQHFDEVITGSDVTRTKPDPEGFLLGAQRVGAAPENSLVVEDAKAGLIGAHSAGMKGVGIGDVALLGEVADHVVPSTAELSLALLQKVAG